MSVVFLFILNLLNSFRIEIIITDVTWYEDSFLYYFLHQNKVGCCLFVALVFR